MKRMMIVLAVMLIAMTGCEKAKVKRLVEKQYNCKVVSMSEDSCYSITRPLMSVQYQSMNATSRYEADLVHKKMMALSDQVHDRMTDHGGLKVRCWVVDFERGGMREKTYVIVEPTGELVTDMDEIDSWVKASSTVMKNITSIYLP